MAGNPVGSPWRSTPRARRRRVAPSWTYPPALIAHVKAEAAREGISASELSERALVAQLGEPPALPPEDEEDPAPEDEEDPAPETVKENRPGTSK